ncbi:MAG: MarR family transcriptional regulator [Clostridia bacterium]|nr:MarR family transcriptional regulator [Clostridia bacterium]
MSDTLYAGDKLLDAWLNLTSSLWNTRLVSSMTYNEAHVLGLLLRYEADGPMTATTLIRRTHLLKSQMNKVLTSLESKGHITRTRSQADRRVIELILTPEGKRAYREEHKNAEAILAKLLERIGEDRALRVARDIDEITDILEDILSGFPL